MFLEVFQQLRIGSLQLGGPLLNSFSEILVGSGQFVSGFPQSRLGLLALGNLPSDFRCADDFPSRVLDRRDREGDLHESAVLALPHGIVMLDALTTANTLENFGFLVAVIRRNDRSDRPADHLRRGVAKKLLRSGVPALHDAVQIFGNNCIVG